MSLSHDVAGVGPAVMLLHSGVCDRRMWDPQWTPLVAAGYRVVRPDFRGFGETPVASRPYNDADDVLSLLDALGIARAALVASSFGGRVAAEVAARWPDRVSALVLLCPDLPGHTRSEELMTFAAREDALLEAGDIAAAVELNVNTWLGPSADETVRELVRRMQRHAFEAQLAASAEFARVPVEFDPTAITAPCLVFSGGQDLTDFRQIAARLPDLLGNARHVELPWAGHLPSLQRPATVTALLMEFLGAEAPVG